tara:strand:+ start:13187 stop:14212 length:1026 start_codon:yes stop_codon:yes gene_type:complete
MKCSTQKIWIHILKKFNMIIDTNPEFGIELTLVVPYAYWLHTKGKLKKVITSKGMAPFYYFCDNVEEKYESRTVDNTAANMDSIPNNWIYGLKEYAELYKDDWPDWEEFANVERGCGILKYDQWSMPDYNNQFKDDNFRLDKPTIMVCNRYNWEHGQPPSGYFDIQCLYNIFNYLTSKGYDIVYKRPKNTEFPLDQNEVHTVQRQEMLTANVEGIGHIDDFKLTEYYDNVTLLDDIVKNNLDLTYNQVQLKLFTSVKGFITMGGGSTLFPCFFQKPTVALYGGTLSEVTRKNFFYSKSGKKNIKNYHFMINPMLTPFIDLNYKDQKSGYNKFLKTIQKTFI